MTFAARESERLILRAITPDDATAIHRYMSDPEVTAFLPEGPLDADGARAFAASNAGEEATAIAVLERSGGDLIGHMVFHPWFVPRTHEIGWVFGRAHQGRGYATEAARSLLAYAFETMGCHRVIATCQPENPPSWRVMEKLGMRREAHFRACIHSGGDEWWDEYFYAILGSEYRASAVPA